MLKELSTARLDDIQGGLFVDASAGIGYNTLFSYPTGSVGISLGGFGCGTPAPAPVYTCPTPAPAPVYTCPTPAPAPVYTCPTPAPKPTCPTPAPKPTTSCGSFSYSFSYSGCGGISFSYHS